MAGIFGQKSTHLRFLHFDLDQVFPEKLLSLEKLPSLEKLISGMMMEYVDNSTDQVTLVPVGNYFNRVLFDSISEMISFQKHFG